MADERSVHIFSRLYEWPVNYEATALMVEVSISTTRNTGLHAFLFVNLVLFHSWSWQGLVKIIERLLRP